MRRLKKLVGDQQSLIKALNQLGDTERSIGQENGHLLSAAIEKVERLKDEISRLNYLRKREDRRLSSRNSSIRRLGKKVDRKSRSLHDKVTQYNFLLSVYARLRERFNELKTSVTDLEKTTEQDRLNHTENVRVKDEETAGIIQLLVSKILLLEQEKEGKEEEKRQGEMIQEITSTGFHPSSPIYSPHSPNYSPLSPNYSNYVPGVTYPLCPPSPVWDSIRSIRSFNLSPPPPPPAQLEEPTTSSASDGFGDEVLFNTLKHFNLVCI